MLGTRISRPCTAGAGRRGTGCSVPGAGSQEGAAAACPAAKVQEAAPGAAQETGQEDG